MDIIYGHTKYERKHRKIMSLIVILLLAIIGINIVNYKKEINTLRKNDTTKVSNVNNYKEIKINKTMIAIAYCAIRDNPKESANKIATYNKGDKVQVISKLSNNWYKVKTSETVGYVKQNYVYSTKDVYIDKEGNIITSVKSDGTIETDGNISNNIINYAYNYWYMIPESTRQNFIDNGWKIMLTDKSLKDELNLTYEICGVTIPKDKIIKIEGNQSSIRKALVHEIGHYIDVRSEYKSCSKQFKKMFKTNGDKLLDYNKSYTVAAYNEKEFFAELYRIHILNIDTIGIKFDKEIKFIEDTERNLNLTYEEEDIA